MTATTIIGFINLFFAGILAGMEIITHYGLRAPSEALPDRAQLQLRQALVLKLRILIPAFFIPTALTGIIITVLDIGSSAFWLRCASLLAILLWTFIRVIGTVPINSATLTWQLDSPPPNWKAQINHAERYHIIGVWAAILAFALFLTAMSLH